MIELYSGTPGSGKSLHLAKDLYSYLNGKRDRLVICNFEINLEKVRHPERFLYIKNDALTVDLMEMIARDYFIDHELKENSIILIIDECQLLFNSRDWARADRRPWLGFFSQHRKYGFLVTLVAQYDEMIDKQIRAVIEYETFHRKVTNYGNIGFFLRLLTLGDWFIAINVWYVLKKQVSHSFFRASKKYYSLYDTFNTFSGK